MYRREYNIEDPNELFELAGEWIERWKKPQIVLLYGDLGAGKTTLVQAFARQLGVRDEVTSPTFSLIQEYEADHGTVYHVDLYRLKDSLELRTEVGLHELLDGDFWVFIEWPELAKDLLDNYSLKRIDIEHRGQNARKIIVLENEFEGETK